MGCDMYESDNRFTPPPKAAVLAALEHDTLAVNFGSGFSPRYMRVLSITKQESRVWMVECVDAKDKNGTAMFRCVWTSNPAIGADFADEVKPATELQSTN